MENKENKIDNILSKEYFKLYPWIMSSSWNLVNDYLVNSDFMEYVFFLILLSKYDQIWIYWTQFDKKDFNVSSKLSFEYENSWDAFIANMENINTLKTLLPSKYKNNIWYFNTPLRKFTRDWETSKVKNLETPYINEFTTQKETDLKELKKSVNSTILKTVSQCITINNKNFLDTAKLFVKERIWFM